MRPRTTTTVLTSLAAGALLAGAAAPAQASAVPHVARVSPTAAPAVLPVLASADIDGDGRLDRITLSYVSKADAYTSNLRLAVRTATGRSSALAYQAQLLSHTWRQSLQGTGSLDGARGREIVVGFGDTVGYAFRVASWKGGRLVWQAAPRRHSTGLPATTWTSSGGERLGGYRFRTVKGVRYVDDLIYQLGLGAGPDYGNLATYRWTSLGWRLAGSRRIGKLSSTALASYMRWSGSGVRVWSRF